MDRVAPYTDAVYVTTLCIDYKNDQYVSMNGNIVVTNVGGELTVICSASNVKLKDTEWFKENRVCPKAWEE